MKRIVLAGATLAVLAAVSIGGQLSRVGASEGKPERRYWEYACHELDTRKPGDSVVLTQLGEKGWEMVAVPAPSMGAAVMCFKREIEAPVPCASACKRGWVCARGRCQSPCNQECDEDQFCGKDRKCHTHQGGE
jgi:hypothetical protein